MKTKEVHFWTGMVLCLFTLLLLGASEAGAQVPFLRAYVDPGLGNDATGQVGSPNLPYKTINQAIIDCQAAVIARLFVNPLTQGIVYCMPGHYGQNNGEVFPIKMRDRVHLQGQGFRRTVIRGVNVANKNIHWPIGPIDNDAQNYLEVLVDYSFEHIGWYMGQYPPEVTENVEEMIDGFTFQGGGVQIYFGAEREGKARTSNCVFDMRHEVPEAPFGPYFGILMVHVYDWDIDDYHNYEYNILNNTFIMGQDQAFSPDDFLCRPEAVAIMDVNDATPSVPPIFWDPNLTRRGVGAPSIQNNLFRTLPVQSYVKVMLGIDSSDTQTIAAGPTNAFHLARVGTNNGTFYSQMDPPLTPLPVPRVDLTSVDPGFIGEFFARYIPGFSDYRDWRLMPDSPLKDQGTAPGLPYLKAANMKTVYTEPNNLVSSFDWDGEIYGNPRSVDNTDIGADEIHLMVMAGCWSNDSNSYHNYPGPLNSSVPSSASVPGMRYMILPGWASGTGTTLRVNGTLSVPPFPGTVPAWFSQPGTRYPFLENLGMPVYYNRMYLMSFTNPPPAPTPWMGTAPVYTRSNPVIGTQSHTFGAFRISDTDIPGAADYFNMQPVVTVNGTVYWGNLQSEYR